MTDKATHTPLPWAVSNGCDQYICNGDHWIASTMGIRGEEGAANARFIVHAVNSHHDLIEALRALIEVAHGYAEYISSVPSAELERHPYLPGLEGQINDARAILTKEAGHG